MKNIFITGADGFIGSHLTEYLVKKNYKVKALVQYNSYNSWGWLDTLSGDVLNSIQVHSGDIRDQVFIEKLTKNSDVIINLAALISIPYSYTSPSSYVATNVLGTLNVLQASLKNKIEKVIQVSTSEVYGKIQRIPIDEKHPLQALSPYAATKIASDQLALSFYHTFKLPVVVLRPFNTYGPRQSARAIIPTVITQILKNEKNIKLGSIYPTRDFSYIDDIVYGFECAIKSNNATGEVINLGSNFEISILNMVKLIAKLMNKNIEIKSDSKRIRPKTGEVDRLYSSNTKAKKLLKWKPNFSGLDGFKKGLVKTISWFEDKKNIIGYKSKESFYNI
jgi:dTDP-glucose 4,6-dehydratase